MVMKYIITEEQLKTLINEQQGVLKLNLEKDEDQTKLRNYCKPVLMDKKIIDTHIAKVDSEVLSYLTSLKNKYTKEYPEISDYFLDIDKLITEIKPLMSSSMKNNIYAKYGHSNYNDSNDMNLIFKKIYDTIDDALQSNVIKKAAVKMLVTKKNVRMIKDGLKEFFAKFKTAIHWLRFIIPRHIMSDMLKDHLKTAPKCTNLLVINNEYGDKVTPYNPSKLPIIKDLKYVETETLINPYIVSVNKTIDSFV
jgi:hypothetical protein